jgi:hypothetical protein
MYSTDYSSAAFGSAYNLLTPDASPIPDTTRAQFQAAVNATTAGPLVKTAAINFEAHVWGDTGLPMTVELTGPDTLLFQVIGQKTTDTVRIHPRVNPPPPDVTQSAQTLYHEILGIQDNYIGASNIAVEILAFGADLHLGAEALGQNRWAETRLFTHDLVYSWVTFPTPHGAS